MEHHMANQKMFFYVRLINGEMGPQQFPANMAQGLVPDVNDPVDSLSNDALELLGLRRVVRLPYPVDGYNYTPGAIEQRDGVWVMPWVQQETPDREQRRVELAVTRRLDRNRALTECDWTQLPDASLSEEQRAQWGAYRQALRDIPTQPTFPWDIQWPKKP
jgi:hypothetical protein